jgi:endonuclease/exonuclease/phosphatase family metal-dependent hydrolase
MLIRTWNLFHGNSSPHERRGHLEEMVRLASADHPDVLCLQEIPVWALDRLGRWSGMTAFPELAAPPRIGPLPSTAAVGKALTALHPGLLRSAFAGQGNAILLRPAFEAFDYHALVLNPRSFRRSESRRLRLGPVARLVWGKERRICQAVRIALDARRNALVANLHATAYSADRRLADAEVRRAAELVLALGREEELCVLAGDLNVERERSETYGWLAEQGFSLPGEGIDHVLVRGAAVSPEAAWPVERRRAGGVLLSDHAPVEVRVE